MEEIEEIITNLFITKKTKTSAIRSQQFYKAAQLRDNEKVLEDKLFKRIFGDPNVLFKRIFGDTNVIPGYSRKSESLEKYFLENYGVEYSKLFEEETFKQVKREMTLRKLGI